MTKRTAMIKRTVFFICLVTVMAVTTTLLAQKTSQRDDTKPGAQVTQGYLAEELGMKLNYKTNYTGNLKAIGITPLGDWDTEKPLTTSDFDAILLRLARISPIVENMEPSVLLDNLGFPPRITTREGVVSVFESEAFRRILINPKMIIVRGLIPLPPTFAMLHVSEKETGSVSPIGVPIIAVPVTAVGAPGEELPPGGEEEPPPPPDEPPSPPDEPKPHS